MRRHLPAAAALIAGLALGTFLAGTLLHGQPQLVPPLPSKEAGSYRDVVKRVLPAVVSIQAKGKPGVKTRLPDGVPEEFRRFQEQQPDDNVIGFGSGVIIDARGVVLTNNHVVEGADSVEVTTTDGLKLTLRDVKGDAKTDLAIIRLAPAGALPALELGNSDAMEVGDQVLAVGAPFGLTGSVTSGIISAKGRSLKMNVYEDFLQTDAAINPGNSGGPLVSLDGKVIGITSAIKSRSGGFQGVGLAISSNLVRGIMDQLQKDGTVRRGYLGVQIKNLTDAAMAAKLGVPPNGGVMVTQVIADTPSAKAGVQDGDVIVALNGKAVRDDREMQTVVATLPIGKAATISVVRDRQVKTLSVTIEEQPADFGVTTSRSSPRDVPGAPAALSGMEVVDLTRELAQQLGFGPTAIGALVVSVEPDGMAAKSGIKRGVLITKVDRTPIRGAAELRGVLEKAALDQGVLVQVRTPQGDSSYVLLRKP